MAATHDDLTGRLKFTVVAAKDLTAKSGGTASPFVIVKWGKQEDKTSVKKNTLNPQWGGEFTFSLESGGSELVLEVWHKGTLSKSFMGQVLIKRQTMIEVLHIDEWIPLTNGKAGNDVSGQLKITLDVKLDTSGKEKVSAKKEQLKNKSEASSSHGFSYQIVEEDIPTDEVEMLFPGQKDRLAELRRASGVTRTKRVEAKGQSSSKFMPDFFEQVDTIFPSLRLMQSNNRGLKKACGAYFATTGTKRDEHAKQIAILTDTNDQEAGRLGPKLKKMEASTSVVKKDPSIKTHELRVRQNIYLIMSKTFVDAILEFQDIQTQYNQNYRNYARHTYQLTNPNATADQLKEAETMNPQAVLQHALMDVRRGQAKDAVNYVKEKHKEILRIERSMLELQRIFNDISVVVAAQAEFVDRIQSNIASAKGNVSKGLTELRKARYYQSHKFKLTPVHLAKLFVK